MNAFKSFTSSNVAGFIPDFFSWDNLSVQTPLRQNDIICEATALYKQHSSPSTFIGLKRVFSKKIQDHWRILGQSICCGIVGHIHISFKMIIKDYETGWIHGSLFSLICHDWNFKLCHLYCINSHIGQGMHPKSITSISLIKWNT